MKKPIITLFLLFLFIGVFADGENAIAEETGSTTHIQLISSESETIRIRFAIDDFWFNEVETPWGTEKTLHLQEGSPILLKDAPDLPKLTTSVIIPDLGNIQVDVISTRFTELGDISIAPSKGNLSREILPSSVPFVHGRIYEKDQFFPGDLATLRKPYILRDHRGQAVVVFPFQYNPVTRTLRIYQEIVVELTNSNKTGINEFHREGFPEQIPGEFMNIYNRHFLNADNFRYNPLEEAGNMLVICYSDFIDEMEPLVKWRNQSGTHTEIVDVATIGDSDAIKSFVDNYYNSNGLTFLLLVGDSDQVPTRESEYVTASDNSYGYITGDDSYPEIFVGRFSAETEEQVETQVERTLSYEKNPSVENDWLSNAIGIASSEGPGDDNEMDWEHMRNMLTDLYNFNYSNCYELYDGDQGGNDDPGNPNADMVSDAIENGTSVILYTGHGNSGSWGTSGFSKSRVDELENHQNLPFIFAAACVNGNFPHSTCFAEAWMRATDDDGNPTGAVATLMSTISQSWDPPMEGQDEMVDILTESYEDNVKRTFAGIAINGCMKMNDTYGVNGEEETDAWTIFGDPALTVRTSFPEYINLVHNPELLMGASQITISCDTDGALVALSKNDTLVASAYVSNGTAVLDFEPFLEEDTLLIVASAFNCIPAISEVYVIPANGPFVVFDTYIVNDKNGNGNGLFDYFESPLLSVGIANVGTENAENLVATLSSSDEYVIINDNSEFYGTIASQESKTIENGFSIEIDPEVPDGHVITFALEISGSGKENWTSYFTLQVQSPVLKYCKYTIDDQDGNNNHKLDPGETALISLFITNKGSSEVFSFGAAIDCLDPFIVIHSANATYGELVPGDTAILTYEIMADVTTPSGHEAYFDISYAGEYNIAGNESFFTIIGQIPVVIIDMDGNQSSGSVIKETIEELGIACDFYTELPENLNLYSSVFVCLGVYWENRILTHTEGTALALYLQDGGNLYMEGSDTWAYNEATAVHELFNIEGLEDGNSDLNILFGIEETFAESMEFIYSGENKYIDHIAPIEPAFLFLENDNPQYGTAVAFDAGNYKTIGTSFEFAGLEDSDVPSTRKELMSKYLQFFGITPVITGTVAGTVTDNDSGLPIKDAIIKIGNYITRSNEEGNYEGLFPVGEWQICAMAKGYEEVCGIVSIEEDEVETYNFGMSFIEIPANLQASLTDSIVSLTWNYEALKSLQYFCIYRCKNGGEYEMTGTNTTRTCTDTLHESGLYSYYITAFYGENSESLPSNIITLEYTSTGINNPNGHNYTTRLGTAYPNPFSHETTIRFTLKEDIQTEIMIYNLMGEEVLMLIDEKLIRGTHEVIWNATDKSGRKVPKGIYIYHMKAGYYSGTRKMILSN